MIYEWYKKEVVILTGAGQIGMAIARRMGCGKKIVIGDKNLDNAQAVAKIRLGVNLHGNCIQAML